VSLLPTPRPNRAARAATGFSSCAGPLGSSAGYEHSTVQSKEDFQPVASLSTYSVECNS
jgi:hypothetical protein